MVKTPYFGLCVKSIILNEAMMIFEKFMQSDTNCFFSVLEKNCLLYKQNILIDNTEVNFTRTNDPYEILCMNLNSNA